MIDQERIILNAIRERRKNGTVQKAVTMTGYPVLAVGFTMQDAVSGVSTEVKPDTIEDWDRAYLLDLVDFLQSLISDLKQEGTAYDRGQEDGAKKERERIISIIWSHDNWMRTRSIELTGNYLELGTHLIGEICRDRNTVTENPT